MNSILNKSFVLFLLVIVGCTKLPDLQSSSVVSYYINGEFVQSFYTSNTVVIETTKNGRNRIILNAESEIGNFGFSIVSDSITGVYTYENSFDNEPENKMTFHFKNGDPFGYGSDKCVQPSVFVAITAWYKGQRTVSGTFQGTVCDDQGNKLEITRGTFEFVKQVDY